MILKAAQLFQLRKQSFKSISKAHGQAAVEFALIATVAMIVLFVAVQLALIGEDALALGQMNYQGARWAAVNTCATPADVRNYILSVGSPSVTQSGGSCGTQLTITVTDTAVPAMTGGAAAKGTICTGPIIPTTCTAGLAQRTFGTAVIVNLSFDATKAIFLLGTGGAANKPWLGLINLPTTLTSTETAMAE